MAVATPASGLAVARRFTTVGADPFDAVEWTHRDAVIREVGGRVVFEQKGVEVPATWSQIATDIVAHKYFRGAPETSERETSVRQLLARVVDTITAWGLEDGYFDGEASARAFHDELVYLLLHQRASFNSPVWFNVGIDPKPQCSACFICSVEDSMESILDLAKTEALLFQRGSGTGSNLSSLRSSRERVASGGLSSGPVAFMRGFDAFAGAIKSGGRTRRAAKMVVLDVDHPDILDFIRSKQEEEAKAKALLAAGLGEAHGDGGGVYGSVFFQNENHAVRVPDAFMEAVADGGTWTTLAVTDGRPVDTYPARELLDAVAEAVWACGDPGLQFETTINAWHTCPAAGPIRASNPCSEFLFLDDSACNLASVNLLAYERDAVEGEGGGLDLGALRHTFELLITAQEILVDRSVYPTPAITEGARRYRPLGLGYANLGAWLMVRGVPYDSPAGRALAASVTALMTGVAYARSAELARFRGPFAGYADNRDRALAVLDKHRRALEAIEANRVPAELLAAARDAWADALDSARDHGLRNAQVTALAPTGTIAFMMDCDTTGVEPELALVKVKQLAGGGSLRLVNHAVPRALARLGYTVAEVEALVEALTERGSLAGVPGLRPEHRAVFDCALPDPGENRPISPEGHLTMVAAVQPFISGAVSKTVNLPRATTPETIAEIFVEAWRLGLKAVAIYRDGCRASQPLRAASASSASGDDSTTDRACPVCGTLLVQNGTCQGCPHCGATGGCG